MQLLQETAVSVQMGSTDSAPLTRWLEDEIESISYPLIANIAVEKFMELTEV